MRVIVMVVALLLTITSQAQEHRITAQLTELKALKNNQALMQQALQEGYERASLCVHCHGKDGNSKRDYIPNLAQQNPEYLFVQFEHFANGQRQDYVMSKLAKGLSHADRIAVALYFSEQKVQSRTATPATSAQGEALYQQVCTACHGKAGAGDAHYPRIAGQPYAFLENTLLHFHDNSSERKNSPMAAVAQALTPEELKAVAAYVANMP